MKKSLIIAGFILILTLPLFGQDEEKQETIWTPQNGGIFALVLSAIGFWIRDKQKNKTFKVKDGQIESIHEVVSGIDGKITILNGKHDNLDKKVVKIGTEVSGLKENLNKEIKRHDEDLKEHSKQILQMAKNNKGK